MTFVPGQFFPYFLPPRHKQPFSNMAAHEACVPDTLLTVEWISFNFYRVVLFVFLMDDMIHVWE